MRLTRHIVILSVIIFGFAGMPLISPVASYAQQIDQGSFAYKLRLAETYEETHDIQSAVRLYEELYKENPNEETVFEGLTRGLIYLKQYDRAEQIVKSKMAEEPSLDVMLLYAKLEAEMNKRSEALDAFRNAEDAIHAKECSQLFPVVYAMMEVSYNQDAVDLLDRMRKMGGDDVDMCTSQIASLYLRLGDYGRASQEFITLLKAGDGNVGMIEQRLAQYMTDSLSRTTVLGALETAIAQTEQTPPVLRLMAWLYGEERNYSKALETIIKLDDLADKSNYNNQGFELLQFADRVRNEGALDVAVKAYDEAIKRLKTSNNARQSFFIGQAELGALKTTEAYYHSRAHTSDEIATLVGRYENYASSQPMSELTLEALNHAGDLAFHDLFDLQRATKDYEAALTRSRGLTDKARDAAFGLVDVAFASENFPLAESRLQSIEKMLDSHRGGNEREIRNHILFDRALSLYYQQNFDSSLVLLDQVANDAGSDYANDAIQLSARIQENNNPSGLPALKVFSTAALAEYSRKYEDAKSAYLSIVESQSFAPLADDAALKAADMLVRLQQPQDAIQTLEHMQEKMVSSPLLDVAAFRVAEITELQLHDKAAAERLYESFLARFPSSSFVDEARTRARRLRGDLF